MSRTSISDVDDPYLSEVRAALEHDGAFGTFRRLPGIRGAIEGVNPPQGVEYRAIVLRQTPGLVDHLAKFRLNDTVGGPATAAYPEGRMSPTTWRYIKVLSDLQVLFGSLDGWHIAEIGIGYGGQCKIINDIYNVARYTMYDLEPVQQLARKYLRHTGSSVLDKLELADFRRLGIDPDQTYDLVISNWAFSECTKEVQERYVKHVIRRSKRGYITYNQISQMYGVESYAKSDIIDVLGFPTELMPEGLNLDLGEDMDNFVIHWHDQPCLGS